MKIFLRIILGILLLMYVTNPDEHTHREAVKDKGLSVFENYYGLERNKIVDGLGYFGSSYLINVDDYYLFSVTKIKILNKETTIGVGVGTKVFFYDNPIVVYLIETLRI